MKLNSTLIGLYYHMQANCGPDERVVVVEGCFMRSNRPFLALYGKKLIKRVSMVGLNRKLRKRVK